MRARLSLRLWDIVADRHRLWVALPHGAAGGARYRAAPISPSPPSCASGRARRTRSAGPPGRLGQGAADRSLDGGPADYALAAVPAETEENDACRAGSGLRRREEGPHPSSGVLPFVEGIRFLLPQRHKLFPLASRVAKVMRIAYKTLCPST